MVVNIHNLIAAVNPDLYCDPEKKKDVKEILDKEKEAPDKYIKAAEKAKPLEQQFVDQEKLYYSSAIDAAGLKSPIEKHGITYDIPGENLEPIYFWIFDFLQGMRYNKVEKLIDNFISTAGSGHFSEMGMKATKMQEEAMKMLGAANQVIKSILNILYDLKEFRTRLDIYKKAKSGDEGAVLSLKQIWMDTVDFKRGTSSIKQMSVQYQYVTIIDAFMAAKSKEDVEKLDLNDRVKRILMARVEEFYDWMDKSQVELEKRYKIEKIYLRSQVNSVQLYARWMKPYLNAARALEQRQWLEGQDKHSAELVTNFSTTLFELMLFCEGEYKPEDDVNKGDLPEIFKDKNKRGYKPVLIVDLKFRTIPGKIQGNNYSFRGKIDVTFTSYALHNDEVNIIKEQVRKDDLKDLNTYIQGSTQESLDVIQKEIDEYLKEDDEQKKDESKKEEEKKTDDVNPFSALMQAFSPKFWFGDSKKKEEEKKKDEDPLRPDNQWEKIMRSQAIFKARGDCSRLYGEFKRAQGMVA